MEWRCVILLGLGVVGSAVAALDRREPHVRWQASHGGPGPELARWFMPGILGYEPGVAPPPPGPAAFLTRALGGVNGSNDGSWAMHNALTPRLSFSHNLSRIVPDALLATHPEFFPLIGGKRVVPDIARWNPDLGNPTLAAWAAQKAAEHFMAQPEAVSFAVGTNDALTYGDSPELRAWVLPMRYFRGRPDFSDLVFNFTNEVARHLEESWPEKHVGALAYYLHEQVPRFPVHPQVLPFLTADRSQGYDRDFWAEEMALQRAWAAAGPRRLGIYDYLYGYGFLVPRYHPTLLAEHLRHARKAGYTDYYAEMSPNWALDGPQPWLVAQLLQDPTQAAERLLAEYFRRYFRAAGPAMARFFGRLEQAWMEQEGPAYWLKHYRNESQTRVYPPAVRRDLRDALGAAAAAAEASEDEVVAARVAWVEGGWGLSERLIEMGEARDALARRLWRRAGVRGGSAEALFSEAEELEELLRIYREARGELVRYDEWLRREKPGAMGPYRLTDLLRHDPTPVAEDRIARLRAATAGEPAPKAGYARLGGAHWNGEIVAPLRMAGLDYGVALPTGWNSRAEPAEGMTSAWADTAEGRVLRLEGHKNTSIWRWMPPLLGPETLRLTLRVRGRVSLSSALTITASWLNVQQTLLEPTPVVILPEGEWPEWVTLEVPLVPGPEAVWPGVALYLNHQMPGDWLEIGEVSVTSF